MRIHFLFSDFLCPEVLYIICIPLIVKFWNAFFARKIQILFNLFCYICSLQIFNSSVATFELQNFFYHSTNKAVDIGPVRITKENSNVFFQVNYLNHRFSPVIIYKNKSTIKLSYKYWFPMKLNQNLQNSYVFLFIRKALRPLVPLRFFRAFRFSHTMYPISKVCRNPDCKDTP